MKTSHNSWVKLGFIVFAGVTAIAHYASASAASEYQSVSSVADRESWTVSVGGPNALKPSFYSSTRKFNMETTAQRYAIDGKPATRWTSGEKQTKGMWFQVDLNEPQDIDQIILRSWVNAKRTDQLPMASFDLPIQFDVLVRGSSEADSWVPVGTVYNHTSAEEMAAKLDKNDEKIDPVNHPGSTISAPINTINFAQQTDVQYIKFELTENGTDKYWWSISEIEVNRRVSEPVTSTEEENGQENADETVVSVCQEGDPLAVTWTELSASHTGQRNSKGRYIDPLSQETWDFEGDKPAQTLDSVLYAVETSKRWTSGAPQQPGMYFEAKFGEDLSSQGKVLSRIIVSTAYDAEKMPDGAKRLYKSMDYPKAFTLGLYDTNGQLNTVEMKKVVNANGKTSICFEPQEATGFRITLTNDADKNTTTMGDDFLPDPKQQIEWDQHSMNSQNGVFDTAKTGAYWWSIKDIELYHTSKPVAPVPTLEKISKEPLECGRDNVLKSAFVDSKRFDGESDHFGWVEIECRSIHQNSSNKVFSSKHVSLPPGANVYSLEAAILLGLAPHDEFKEDGHQLTPVTPGIDNLASCPSADQKMTGLALEYNETTGLYVGIDAICVEAAELKPCINGEGPGCFTVGTVACSPLFEAWGHPHYRGKHYRWGLGCDQPDNYNDKISSFKVRENVQIKVCEHKDLEGECAVYRPAFFGGKVRVAELSRAQPTGFDFNDKISSWRLREMKWVTPQPVVGDHSHLTSVEARQKFFREQAIAYIDSTKYKGYGHKNEFFAILAKEGRLLQNNILHTQALDKVIADFDTKETADFRISLLVRTLFLSGSAPNQYDELIRPALEKIHRDGRFWLQPKKWGEGEDQYVYWSENHILMWTASAYLLHQRYKDIDLATKPSNERWQDHGEAIQSITKRLHAYLDAKINYGFYEFFSTTYYRYTLGALLNLADFAKDRSIKRKATQAAKRLMKEMLLVFNDRGAAYPAAGRSYPNRYTKFKPDVFFWVLTGRGELKLDENGPGYISSFITTTNLDLSDVEQSYSSNVNIQVDQGHDLEDSKLIYPSFNRVERAVFQWSAGAFAHPETVNDTANAVSCYGLQERSEFKDLKPFLKPNPFTNTRCRDIPITPSLFSSVVSHLTVGSNLSRSTVKIFKNKNVVLSSLRKHHSSYKGYQQFPWAAAIEDIAIWTQTGEFDSRGVSHNSHLPYVQQLGNVALITYYPTFIIGNSPVKKRVNLHWPTDRFDENEAFDYDGDDDLSWLVARKAESYIAVVRYKNDKHDGFPSSDANQGRQMWAVVVGNQDMHGSYENFKKIIRAARLYESFKMHYDIFPPRKVYVTEIEADGKTIKHSRPFAN